MPDSIPIRHPKLRPEELIYVLHSDWNRLADEVKRIGEPKFNWGNLAFTVLGFALSCLLSIGVYHATATQTGLNHTLLGVGYALGVLCLPMSYLLYMLHSKSAPDNLHIKEEIQKCMKIVEAKLIVESETGQAAIVDADSKDLRRTDLSQMKTDAFKSLTK